MPQPSTALKVHSETVWSQNYGRKQLAKNVHTHKHTQDRLIFGKKTDTHTQRISIHKQVFLCSSSQVYQHIHKLNFWKGSRIKFVSVCIIWF